MPKLSPDDDEEDWAEFARWADLVDAMARMVEIEPEHIARHVAGCSHESALI